MYLWEIINAFLSLALECESPEHDCSSSFVYCFSFACLFINSGGQERDALELYVVYRSVERNLGNQVIQQFVFKVINA